MAKSQKQAVIEQVEAILPNFVKFKDNALQMLSNTQLETIKSNIAHDIANLNIDYGKDPFNMSEVTAYARSMVMNHLKKAKELNGGNTYTPSSTTAPRTTVSKTNNAATPKVPKGVDYNSLPDDLKEIATKLV